MIKRFIHRAIWFSIFSSLVYFVFIFFGGSFISINAKSNLVYIPGSYGHLNSRLKEINHFKNVEVLFLGSSHTYRGFDPRIFEKNGITTFNLGSSSQTPIQTGVFLRRYLKIFNPKLVVYEVYPGSFSSDGVESALDLISNDKIDWENWRMALQIRNIKVFNTLLFAFQNSIFNKNPQINEAAQKDKDIYISGGYVQKDISFNKETSFPESQWDLKMDQFAEFEKNIFAIRESGANLILVHTPITNGLYRSKTNYEYFNMRMDGYGEYYNFNEIMDLNDTLHFYDSHHLNQIGVELFNKTLIEIIFEK